MKGVIYCIALVGITTAAGCAGKNKPIIDPAGVDMELYQNDLAACEQISQQVEQKAGAGAAGGAIVGGLIGAVLSDSHSAKELAGAGAVSGGAKGIADTEREKALVVKNCLRNRGYKVLN